MKLQSLEVYMQSGDTHDWTGNMKGVQFCELHSWFSTTGMKTDPLGNLLAS